MPEFPGVQWQCLAQALGRSGSCTQALLRFVRWRSCSKWRLLPTIRPMTGARALLGRQGWVLKVCPGIAVASDLRGELLQAQLTGAADLGFESERCQKTVFSGEGLGECLIAAQQAQDSGGVVGDTIQLALRFDCSAVANLRSNALVGAIDGIRSGELVPCVGELQPGKVNLCDHRHLCGHPTLVCQCDPCLSQLNLGGARYDVQQVEGQLQARFIPDVVEQIVVGVLLQAVAEGEVGKQA